MEESNSGIQKEIIGYEGLYSISRDGTVKSLPKKGAHGGAVKKQFQNKDGYHIVHLCKNSKCKSFLAHRVVYENFSGAIPQNLEINHIDGNKSNNHIGNLEVATRSENMRHAFMNGLATAKGTGNTSSKLTDENVILIRILKRTGRKYLHLAEKYGVSKSAIFSVASYRNWNHLP